MSDYENNPFHGCKTTKKRTNYSSSTFGNEYECGKYLIGRTQSKFYLGDKNKN